MSFPTSRQVVILLICALPFTVTNAAAQSQVDESWMDNDIEERSLQVNEGELQFIAPLPDRPILHSDTQLRLTDESLRSGWVTMRQCYRHLDAVSKTDVVYAYREMKNLRVTGSEKIAQVRVRQNGVELEQVEKGATLCLRADVKILRQLSDRTWRMHSGPYHRKFLDGYYPYHVSLTVYYPTSEMQLQQVLPQAQRGFDVAENSAGLRIDSWFEGVLRISFEFSKN